MVKNISLACVLVWLVLTLSAVKAHGQLPSPRSYLFVQIKDTSGQPVTDASIAVYGADGKRITGGVSSNLSIRSDHHYSVLVSKNGFLPSEHVFFPKPYGRDIALVEKLLPLGYAGDPSTIILRRPPTTAAERKAVEAEELQAQLILAAKRGDSLRASKLLQMGISADAVDADGVSALLWALFAGDAETIDALLASGARVNTKNPLDSKALLIYFSEGIIRDQQRKTSNSTARGDYLYKRERIVSDLIKAGADVNAEDAHLGTALIAALRAVPTSLPARAIDYLVRAGANVNTPEERQRATPLMWASRSGSLESVKMLLAAGASIGAKNKAGGTALMWAQVARKYTGQRYNPEIVRTLLSAGAKVNESDESGYTPLLLAAQADLTESVKLLLAAGAQVNVKNKWGRSALILAFDSHNYAQTPEDSTPHPAPSTIRALVTAGADIHAVDSEGMPLLMRAARTDAVEALKVLLEAGASINVTDKKGHTVLMYSRWDYIPSVEALKALIAAKADLNALYPDGRTVLMFAASDAPPNVLKLLLETSAKTLINARDKYGRTALMHACTDFSYRYEEQIEIAKALLEAGADVNIKDNSGRTAIDVAQTHTRNQALIELLKSKLPK